MPTLNDILTANGDYTPVSGYPVDDKYEDDSPVINVYDRTIGEIIGDTSTSGENVSQYLTFRIPRHPDHYDLIENGTNIRILYRLEDDTGEDVVPVNVVANEDYIIFGWKIPLVVTVNPGVVTFIIHAYKSENNLITYHYKTLPKTYTILETMETDVVVPEIEMYNLAEAYARGTITDVFGQTRPVEEGEPGYHDNSKYYKELAGTSKTDAETAKNAAEAAQEAAEEARQAAEDARDQAVAIVGGEYVSYGQTQSLNDAQKAKARENIEATGPNGYYPNMTVGLSENFVGTGEPTRRVFDYDTAGGSADISDGNAEIEKMYGDTIVWNQLVQNGNFVDATGWVANSCSISASNNELIANIPSGATGNTSVRQIATWKSNHKYYIHLSVYSSVAYTNYRWGLDAYAYASIQSGWNDLSTILTPAREYNDFYLFYQAFDNATELKFKNAICIDLTQMFGAGNEPATVEEFNAMFPLDYYPYNEGTLLNVNPAGIKTVGFNAYDKATGKAALIGGNQYQITGTYTSLSYSTGEVLTPDTNGCFTPTKTGELTVTGGGENTCVHLTWSGYRNGDYEDYWVKTRDINIQPYFPDGLKRAGSVYDEISKNKAVKRIGKVDLGSLDWEDYMFSGVNIHLALPTNRSRKNANVVCAKYLSTTDQSPELLIDKTLTGNVGGSAYIYVRDDSYATANAFKTAMSGVYLYYELETPVETQIDPPLNLLYQVSDFGTEQFIGAGATEPKTLPVIADIVYDANYRDTIKNLPKNYAKVSGYYPDLYTGLADNLIDRKGNGTPQEISYRTSCGDDSIADDGNGIIQSIFGKTVVWNQLVRLRGVTSSGVTVTPNADGSFTLNGTANDSEYLGISESFNIVNGHNYFVGVKTNQPIPTGDGVQSTYNILGARTNTDVIGTVSGDRTSTYMQYRITNGTTYDNLKVWVIVVDLTMYDSTRTFTPTTARAEFPNNSYPYNSGELISYNGSGIKTVGFNLFDENTIMIQHGFTKQSDGSFYLANLDTAYGKVIWKNEIGYTGQVTVTYDAKYLNTLAERIGLYLRVHYKDGTSSTMSTPYSTTWGNGTFVTTQGKIVDQIVWDYNSGRGQSWFKNININFSWSGYRNGEYEPYWSRTLNLPISTYFPDGMKSAGSVRDEMTKDKAVKRIGKVDLGSLDWVATNLNGHITMTAPLDCMPRLSVEPANLLCENYTAVSTDSIYYNGVIGIGFHPTLKNIWLFDSAYTDATAFKQAMNGVMLAYELATPIETTITPPLDLTYKVADFGTEESIAEGKSTPFNGIINYSDDFTRGLVNMPKNYDTTASLDALATSLSTMLTSALDGTVTITRGAYDSTNKKYAWNCTFTENQSN